MRRHRLCTITPHLFISATTAIPRVITIATIRIVAMGISMVTDIVGTGGIEATAEFQNESKKAAKATLFF